MEEKKELKYKFLESNKEIIDLFNELHNNYESLKEENVNLINQTRDLHKNRDLLKANNIGFALDVNSKFGILNLAKINEEAIFDAINYFNKSCPYCKTDLYVGNIRRKIEIDHFFPIAKGGQDFPWNLLPICKECNRKKRDKLPFEYLDESTYSESYKYLESVLFRLTNSHEDKLQRDEITYNLLMDLFSKKITKDSLITELYRLFNINIISIQNDLLNLNDVKDEIILNKEHLFGSRCGFNTTEKKVANYLYNNKPTSEQKNSVKMVMRDLFNDCRFKSNMSVYSTRCCREKII